MIVRLAPASRVTHACRAAWLLISLFLRLSCSGGRVIISGMSKRVVILVLVTAGLNGCLERKLTITTEPEGALVILSDKEVGRTPLTTTFTWHGDYDIIIRYPEKGYEMLNVCEGIYPKWYEWPPIDLLSQLAPWTYRDHRYLHYKLTKYKTPKDEDMIHRAKDLQRRNATPVKR